MCYTDFGLLIAEAALVPEKIRCLSTIPIPILNQYKRHFPKIERPIVQASAENCGSETFQICKKA
jgi:hypothetical protein